MERDLRKRDELELTLPALLVAAEQWKFGMLDDPEAEEAFLRISGLVRTASRNVLIGSSETMGVDVAAEAMTQLSTCCELADIQIDRLKRRIRR